MIRSKAKADAPNYRNGGPSATQVCVTCRHESPTRDNWCNKFSFEFSPQWICDAFRPDVEAVRERSSNLASRTKAEMDEAQRKAMFAKMGAAGKLNKRNPETGKRTGGKTGVPKSVNDAIKKAESDTKEELSKMSPSEREFIRVMWGSDKKYIAHKRDQAKREEVARLSQLPKPKPEAPKKGGSRLTAGQSTIVQFAKSGTFTKVFGKDGATASQIFEGVGGEKNPTGAEDYRNVTAVRKMMDDLVEKGEMTATGTGKNRVYNVVEKQTNRTKAEMDDDQRRAMFASMGASGKLNARGAGGKRSEAEQSKINREIKDLLDSIDGNEGIEESIRPKGRAPKGEGKEFAAKRWIADRMQNMRRRAERLEARIAQNTGTKRQRKAATRASIVLDSVNEALKMSEYMVENLRDSGIPFSDSRELFNDVFAIPQALTGGM